MDAYKLFQDGWIRQILHKEIDGISFDQVAHSMRIREKPIEPWVIVSGDGITDSAHCICMAVLGGCCNHVAALLFALETSTRIKKDATVTDAPAYWMLPSYADLSSPYKRLSEMHLESAMKKQKMSTGEKKKHYFSGSCWNDTKCCSIIFGRPMF
ncbi:hypothetical protein ACJMK2_006017 [Sinanodonta woodiana]|uniref:SWIM-type domain-containing protein n=1 Tax=Sinanodonta woodiana TaxID=1069815 RepID=A0ABD3VT75_SINWO